MSIGFPGDESTFLAEVAARLDEAGPEGLREGQAAGLVGAEPGDVLAALGRLEREGRAVEIEGRWFSPRHAEWIVGVVSLLDSGDALLREQDSREPGWFVRRRNLRRAEDRDTVLARPTDRKRRPTGDRLPEAGVVKVLSRSAETVVGFLETVERRRGIVPFDPGLDLDVEVDGADGIPDGHWVVATLERPSGEPARARVVEVLGDVDEPGVDVLVVLRHHGIPDEFPPDVAAQGEAAPADPGPADWAGREDLRELLTITIDGASARDFDDAVSLEHLPIGRFRLGVHIADVAHYVAEGGALDLEAYRRGTSVYYPERAVPMLPEAISNGLCSLRPEVPRLTLSVFLDLDRHGRVLSRRFAETVIRSDRRMTYSEVRRLLEEPRRGDDPEYGRVLPMLRDMRSLMEMLLAARAARGSIDFDLPEGDVELDTDGVVVGILPEERNVAHRIVEEFMIAANEAVARELVDRGVPALFRVHTPPRPQRLEELAEILHSLGLKLEGELDDLPPSALQAVLRKVEGHAEERFLSTLVLRTMQRAHYSPDCLGHYALASEYYCHFTSPIRRYPDLVVHRQLKALVRGAVERETERTRLPERLPAMGEHTSATEKRAEQSERDLLQWKKVRFLADRVGETFPGRITGVQPFGLFVQLDELYVDGLVPIRTLEDDYYVYEPESHRLVGERNHRVFRLADAVEVVLSGISERHRGLDLKLADLAGGGGRPPRRHTPDRGERKRAERTGGKRRRG